MALLFGDALQHFHAVPVDRRIQDQTVAPGGSFVGGAADSQFPVGLLIFVIVGVAFVVIDCGAGFCVLGKIAPHLLPVDSFFKDKEGS